MKATELKEKLAKLNAAKQSSKYVKAFRDFLTEQKLSISCVQSKNDDNAFNLSIKCSTEYDAKKFTIENGKFNECDAKLYQQDKTLLNDYVRLFNKIVFKVTDKTDKIVTINLTDLQFKPCRFYTPLKIVFPCSLGIYHNERILKVDIEMLS